MTPGGSQAAAVPRLESQVPEVPGKRSLQPHSIATAFSGARMPPSLIKAPSRNIGMAHLYLHSVIVMGTSLAIMCFLIANCFV